MRQDSSDGPHTPGLSWRARRGRRRSALRGCPEPQGRAQTAPKSAAARSTGLGPAHPQDSGNTCSSSIETLPDTQLSSPENQEQQTCGTAGLPWQAAGASQHGLGDRMWAMGPYEASSWSLRPGPCEGSTPLEPRLCRNGGLGALPSWLTWKRAPGGRCRSARGNSLRTTRGGRPTARPPGSPWKHKPAGEPAWTARGSPQKQTCRLRVLTARAHRSVTGKKNAGLKHQMRPRGNQKPSRGTEQCRAAENRRAATEALRTGRRPKSSLNPWQGRPQVRPAPGGPRGPLILQTPRFPDGRRLPGLPAHRRRCSAPAPHLWAASWPQPVARQRRQHKRSPAEALRR